MEKVKVRQGKKRIRRRAQKALELIKRVRPGMADNARIAFTEDSKTIQTAVDVYSIPTTAVILGIVFTDKPEIGTPGYYFYEDRV